MDKLLACAEARAMVSDYMNGELDEEHVHMLEYHLLHCLSCPPLYQSLVEIQRHLQQQQPVRHMESVQRVMQHVNEAIRVKKQME